MVTPGATISVALTVAPGVTSAPMAHALTKFRTSNGLSMEQVAKLAGTTRQSIFRIESGGQTPSLALVQRLIDASSGSLSADDFLPSAQSTKPPTHANGQAA